MSKNNQSFTSPFLEQNKERLEKKDHLSSSSIFLTKGSSYNIEKKNIHPCQALILPPWNAMVKLLLISSGARGITQMEVVNCK